MLYLSIINYSECEPATLKVKMKMQQMKVKGDGWWGVMYKLKCLLHVILGLAFFNYYFRFVFHFAVH